MIGFFTSLRRTPYQSLAIFLVLFFTLFLTLALLVSLSFLNGLLNYIETRPQVTVYFQNQTSQNDIFKVRDQLMESGKVLSVKYVSKEEAFKIYKEFTKDNPLLSEMISAEILPASLEIFAQKPAYLPEVAEFLKKQGGVDEVQFQKDIFNRLLTLTAILRKVALSLFVYLLLMSTIVLSTIILFKIAMKKDEIELLKLLGASNFYIKKPFLGEAIFYGFFTAIIAFGILAGILFYFNPFLASYLRGIPQLSLNFQSFSVPVWPLNLSFLLLTFGIASFFGISIALLATVIATQKYLNK